MTLARAVTAISAVSALVFLVLAMTLPMWVVGSYKGDGKVGLVTFDVDVHMGDGLWKRNVCFGKSDPQKVMEKVGLSCNGRQQTKGCKDDEEDMNDMSDECKKFYGAQTAEVAATAFAVLACLTLLTGHKHATIVGCVASLLTGLTALGVVYMLHNTYLYKHHDRVRFTMQQRTDALGTVQMQKGL